MDQKEKIKKVIGNFVKNHNIIYKTAKDKRIKNRKAYDQNKKTKQLQKSLSKDRFNTYLDSTYKASDSTYKEKK